VVRNARKETIALALLVHPNMGTLSSLQRSFEMHGMHSVVSRDMPTALLALSQHDFSVVVIRDRISETDDGWALGSLARRLYPEAHIAVVCTEKDVAALQSAINSRLDEVFDEKAATDQIAEAILRKRAKDETDKVQ
jgi:ActR/RegA family two-component response regulator